MKEDPCPLPGKGFKLEFRYVLSKDDLLKSLSPVDRVSVFVFDQNDIFVSRIDTSGVDLSSVIIYPGLDDGTYRLVAWAGLDDAYEITPMLSGETHFKEALLKVSRKEDHTVIQKPALLFHGTASNVAIDNSCQQTLVLPVQRATTTVSIAVRGLEPQNLYAMWLEYGFNAYYFDHTPSAEERLIYLPHSSSGEDIPGELYGDFTTMRLSSLSQPLLRIKGAQENDLFFEVDLVKDILTKYPGVDFEFDDNFLVEIDFKDNILTGIRVNGWKVIEETVD